MEGNLVGRVEIVGEVGRRRDGEKEGTEDPVGDTDCRENGCDVGCWVGELLRDELVGHMVEIRLGASDGCDLVGAMVGVSVFGRDRQLSGGFCESSQICVLSHS